MKIGIVTLMGFFNYGNRLQNFAVTHILRRLGYEAETMQFVLKDEMNHMDRLKEGIRHFVVSCPSFILDKIVFFVPENKKYKIMRTRKFYEFEKRYIPIRRVRAKSYRDICKKEMWKEYSYFVAGSDQIWNPDFAGNHYYFLDFAESRKRIAFAASIGYGDLSESVQERYTPLLKEMSYISVRETSAAKLIHKMTGKESEVFPDPTLLVDRKVWERMATRPEMILPQEYALTFFLGDMPKKAVAEFENKTHLTMIHMNRKEYPQYAFFSPAEFLYMIKHAKYVLTDSFHGSVFSIQFEKQFFVFERREEKTGDMFTRLTGLLSHFHIEKRKQSREYFTELSDISDDEWEKIKKQIANERRETLCKMKKVLK